MYTLEINEEDLYVFIKFEDLTQFIKKNFKKKIVEGINFEECTNCLELEKAIRPLSKVRILIEKVEEGGYISAGCHQDSLLWGIEGLN